MLRDISPACFLSLLVAAGCGGGDTTGAGGTGGGHGGGGAGDQSAGTLIMTDKGPVQGEIRGETRVFLGVPYAAPPVGDLRWKPPVPHATWSAPLDATRLGPSCAQLTALSP